MNDLERMQHLTRQLPVQRLRMKPWDYVRFLPRAVVTAVWYRLRRRG